MTTMGDRVLNLALPKIGEKSLFTKDLEDALKNGGVDFVVHSLKDLPTALPIGMAIGAILEREDPRDVLILNAKHKGKTLKTLPKGSTIGTSSLRRSAQLARTYKHLNVCDIRGNLNTRLAKLDSDETIFDGIILAQAGVNRMGWQERISQILEPNDILYAVGQGALAVECRSNDEYILDMLSKLCHLDTQCRILAERSFLKTLGGGCSAPVAVHTNLKRNHDTSELNIIGAVWSLDGTIKIQDQIECQFPCTTDTPRKKQKTKHEHGAGEGVTNKNSPPKIIDDFMPSSSKMGAGDTSDMTMQHLINIHGDLFKKCPFSSKLPEKDSQNTSKADTQGSCKKTAEICPINFAVGQDVMGECPVFETAEQKLVAFNKLGGESKDCSAKAINTQESKNNVEKCPFQPVLFDYDETKKIENVPDLIDNSDILYCGMYRQKYITEIIFQSCEQLGKKLAGNLIKKGALEVMQVAQNEIREKV